jgi:ferric-dicitrate binding protein FerR (iron transport regulator)
MKHDDLWKESLDDALPRELAAVSLAGMRRSARRRRYTRRAVATMSVAAVALAIILWPQPRTDIELTEAPVHSTNQVPVQKLSNVALIERLNDAGYGVAVIGSGAEQEILLVSHEAASNLEEP